MTTEDNEKTLKWLQGVRDGLELAESLEQNHGLEFTDAEKNDLRVLREVLPALEAVFRKIDTHRALLAARQSTSLPEK
ncbi:MAG TPA: hypothetical protein VFG23_02125 [Polyangia bacterium]|nr:hypothetical protein [Polyangia bacterium]